MKDGGIMVIDKIEVDSRKFGYPLLVKAFNTKERQPSTCQPEYKQNNKPKIY